MEITINSIIIGLQSIKAFLDYSEFKGLEEQTKVQCFVLDEAIDTMRKYQKIQKIIEDWESDKGWALEMSELYWLDRIKEVIEDGNDD